MFLIKENLKEAILTEYQLSTIITTEGNLHNINNRYLNTKEHQKEEKLQKNHFCFDAEDEDHYIALVEGLEAKDTYLQPFGNVHNIEWDYQILERTISIILSYRSEIKKHLEVGTYSDYNLVSSYIYNVMCYSIMNQKVEVDYETLISTFKDWDYLPYSLCCDIVKKLITKLDLPEELYPFTLNKKVSPKQKIVKIEKFKQGK